MIYQGLAVIPTMCAVYYECIDHYTKNKISYMSRLAKHDISYKDRAELNENYALIYRFPTCTKSELSS